ncbi:polysaccharide biosynthesis protein [Coriobacteriaceae bacterium BV3Ac1]|uniref:lipopolysaccharide biosynthesis protein n=1 Tax=Olegusella massiliensis TaxID=1776381 RepID=UPI0003ADDA40|nr:polysaccharide biosynthesis protein [Olegusella massiliensis]ERL12339.1 polysaccharide biosynthesis protein [Coriobacteriaceae bacterium BV3Ac1]
MNKVFSTIQQRRARAAQARRVRAARNARRPSPAEHKPSPLVRIINSWWDRLLQSVTRHEFGDAVELYGAGRTQRDYIWNSLGLAAWGAEFPFLTVVVTQLVGVKGAGMFSMAYVTGMMLMFIGNYGARTFQVSDVHEEQSFAAYQIQRFLACALMVAVGVVWCALHQYDHQMNQICFGVFGFRMIDALADVYEGRLQQQDKLYLAGISQALRSSVTFIACSAVLLLTRNLATASMALLIGAIASFLFATLPLALLETPKSRTPEFVEIREIFIQCFPAAAALFLYAVIDNMPKFAMEGALSYDNQLYYNAIYFPAHAIIMTVGFVYKPQLVRLANVWADPRGRRRFDVIILAVLGVTAAVTAVVAVIMSVIGIKAMSFCYGVDFERFGDLIYAMIISGGIAAAIDFLYQIITVVRQQEAVTKLYTLGFAISVPVSYGMVHLLKLRGAVYASLVTMGVLLILLAIQYVTIRRRA